MVLYFQKNNSRYDYGDFLKGDMVGVGIIHWPNSKIECFATSNGELLGKNYLMIFNYLTKKFSGKNYENYIKLIY